VPAPIAILGAGVSGLTTALTLVRRGRQVVIYSHPAARPPASAVAPAMFTPYAPADSPTFRRRAELSFNSFAKLASDPATGVRLGELREYMYSPAALHGSWLDDLLSTRSIPAPAPVRLATTSIRPHIDMDRYLPWLRAALSAEGARFDSLLAPSFDAVFSRAHQTVINCSGLGARALSRDSVLKPMHGQVLHIPNDIGLDYSIHDDAPAGLVAYIFTFGDRLILGGTFELGREGADTDEPSLAAIIDRCRNLLRLSGHPRWADLARRRTEVRAAPRPSRGRADTHEAIRLEREVLPTGQTLIHNYGHGRTGVTLSWGCAAEAADLALTPTSILPVPPGA
jgi:D-amino-acid oxidase